MANALLVSDLHLTAQPRDEYRWKLFAWLLKQIKDHNVSDLLILGDLTDAKDYHSSMLVNRIVEGMVGLKNLGHLSLKHIHILRGNHDGTDPNYPYFWFLGYLPGVQFYKEPCGIKLFDRKVLMLPHSRQPLEDWGNEIFSEYEAVFAHVTVNSARGENDTKLEGVGADIFDGVPVWSGDVHVPQTVGCVEYVGAPYPVRFGDTFEPRVVLLDERLDATSIPCDNLQRRMIDITSPTRLERIKVTQGDQVKVRITLTRSEYGLWAEHKKAVEAWAKKMGVDLVAVELVKATETVKIGRPQTKESAAPDAKRLSKEALFKQYCKRANVNEELEEVGEELLK